MAVPDPVTCRRLAAALAAAAGLACAAPAAADLLNSYKVILSIGGADLINAHGGGPGPQTGSGSRSQGGVTANLSAEANQFTAAKVDLSGTGSAVGKVQANTSFTFMLKPPAGASVKGGRLVLRVALEGTATGDADVHLLAGVQADFGKGEGSALISHPSTPRVEFDVAVPIAAFIEDIEKAPGTVHLHVDATARLAGGAAATATAEAKPATRVVSFKVENGAGAQVPGFTMAAAGGNIPEASAVGPLPPATAPKVAAVEFYNAAFRHYFVSANAAEIAKLDDGTFAGWARTGLAFNVHAAAAPGLAPVCRFFTVAFPPTSSHFYAPRGLGCEGTLANAQWRFEGEDRKSVV